MRRKNATCILITALLGLAACETVPIGPTISENELRQLVRDRYVEPFRRGDIDRWITIFHEDALAMHNHRPADKGRSAIEKFGRMVHRMLVLDQYDVRVTDIRSGDGWAYTAGVYDTSFLLKSTGEKAWEPESGKFVLFWERQPGGEWLVVLDMGNSSLPR